MASLRTPKRVWVLLFSGFLLLQIGCASTNPRPEALPADGILLPAPAQQSSTTTPVQSTQLTPDELDQLVAPIALYPDALVAQLLAASTYPTQIVEANRWIQEHADLKGQPFAQAVDQQPWDPSVKALTQFPSVLAMMDKNLSWTSALGEAYANQAQSVMDAVQVMRRRAQQAGNLKSTPQENVTNDESTIVIAPVNPQVVYVPEYDPWIVYGAPLALYPGWFGVPGVFYDGPGVYFGLGIGIGFFGGFGWGWHHWEPDWRHHDVMFDHHRFASHSPTFFNHNWRFDGHGHFDHGPGAFGHADPGHANFGHADIGHPTIVRPNFGPPGGFSGHVSSVHPGAFGGFNHGGVVGAYSARGRASFGGGFHSGAAVGGFHGGGFHR